MVPDRGPFQRTIFPGRYGQTRRARWHHHRRSIPPPHLRPPSRRPPPQRPRHDQVIPRCRGPARSRQRLRTDQTDRSACPNGLTAAVTWQG